MASKQDWKKFHEEIAANADWEKFANKLGLVLSGVPTHDGWQPCRSIDGGDANPSACFNVISGYYKDHRDGNKGISSYDLLYVLGKTSNFIESTKYIAKEFGVKMPAASGEDPDNGVKWQPWRDTLLTQFVANKQGITVEGLKAAGAQLCIRFGVSCIALPVVSTRPPFTINGWMFMRRDGRPFVDKDGNEKKCICKTYSTEKGLVTSPSIIQAIHEYPNAVVHWCEGAPDMLAGLSRFPNAFFVTNPHGCAESLSAMQRDAVRYGGHWNFIADADEPGIAGASKRHAELNKCDKVTVMHPPFEVSKNHGKDYRDYLCLQKQLSTPTDGLVKLTEEQSEKVVREREEQERRDRAEMHEREVNEAHRTLKKVGCQILSVSHGGEVELYSSATKSAKTIPSISGMQYDDMIQFLGFDFRYFIFQKAEDMMREERGGMLFKDFKKLLALACTDVRYQNSEKVGAGIWAVEDKDHERTGDLMIVQHGGAYKYDGHKLEEMSSPVCERMIAAMSERIEWFNPDILVNYIERARDDEWRFQTYKDLYKVLKQWNWGHDAMVELTCGLIFASFMQSVHKWRPMVTVTGESNSGKTVLMQYIETLFLGLANASARSTAAGVLQSLGDNSQPILLDEFDNGTQQEGLMERFRVASRGQSSLYGTAHQTGKSYKIRHIVWFGGIYAASSAQADINRMINLRLLKAPNNKKTIQIPTASETRDLGHRILAGVIVTANRAVALADRLGELADDSEKIQSRYRESFSVPYGNLGAFLAMPIEEINKHVTDYLTNVVASEVALEDAESDQEQLLLDILSQEVRLPGDGSAPVDHASVAEILFKPNLAKFRDHCRTKGVGYIIPRKGTEPKVAFAGRRLAAKGGLLRGTDWSDRKTGLLQILERLPTDLCPRKEKQVIAGSLLTCVSVDYRQLRRWCEGDDDRKKAVRLT